MLIERMVVPKKSTIVLPDSSEATSDEVFKVLQVGPGEFINGKYWELPKVKKGDVVAIVGYLNAITYLGEKILLARARDVVVKFKEG